MERPKSRNPGRLECRALQQVDNASPQPAGSAALFQRNSITERELHAVLWSTSGDHIPEEQLARPHTSNPRYSRDMSTPKKCDVEGGANAGQSPVPVVDAAGHRAWQSTAALAAPLLHQPQPPVVVAPLVASSPAAASTPAADSDTATSASVGPVTTSTPRYIFAGGHAAGSAPTAAPESGVLWAWESAEVDPSSITRPHTSNPWLARIIDTEVPVVNEEVPAAGSFTAAGNLGSEILWSSDDVADWRLLARPHASNPQYEAIQEESESPSQEVPDRWVVRGSEILWKRDETIDDLQGIVVKQRRRIAQLEQEVVALRQLLDAHGIPPLRRTPVGSLETAAVVPEPAAAGPPSVMPRQQLQPHPPAVLLDDSSRSPAGGHIPTPTLPTPRRHPEGEEENDAPPGMEGGATAVAYRPVPVPHGERQQRLAAPPPTAPTATAGASTRLDASSPATASPIVAPRCGTDEGLPTDTVGLGGDVVAAGDSVRRQMRVVADDDEPVDIRDDNGPYHAIDDVTSMPAELRHGLNRPGSAGEERTATTHPPSVHGASPSKAAVAAERTAPICAPAPTPAAAAAAASPATSRFVSKFYQPFAHSNPVALPTEAARPKRPETAGHHRPLRGGGTTAAVVAEINRSAGSAGGVYATSHIKTAWTGPAATPPTGKGEEVVLRGQRPMSAPALRRPLSSGSGSLAPAATGGAPFLTAITKTVSQLHSLEEVDEENIHDEYLNLLQPDVTFVRKDDFKIMYQRRAEEFGLVQSSRELDRTLAQYNAAGSEYLTYQEFAVLYWKLVQW